MAFARPVLAAADADSELAPAVEEGSFGWRIAPGDPGGLADALEHAARLGCGDLHQLGEAGRRYVERFEWRAVLAAFERVLAAVKSAE